MPIEDLKVKPEILSPKPPSIASDEEFAAGTSTTASPTVKQAKEKLVTTDTTQTISGQKVFTTQLLRKSTDIDVTSQATSATYNTGIRFFDKNLKDIGAVNNARMNGGNIRTVLEARNKDGYVPSIGVQAPYEGSTGGFGYAPNTPDNAPANAIVTKDKIANMVTTNTAQTISGVKTFSALALHANTPVLLKQDNANEGGQIHFQRSNNSVLNSDPSIDLWINTIRFIGVDSNNTVSITMQVDLENRQVIVPTPAANANDNQAATTAWVRNFLTPTGTIIVWSTSTPPAGYLVCNGAAISRTTYANLFKVIGTTWGAGDGNTTFNLPNFGDRVIQGSGTRGSVGDYKSESLPNITGTTGFARDVGGGGWVSTHNPRGCFYQASTNAGNGLGSSHTDVTAGVLGFAASNISSTYQDKAPVQQAATVVNFCIRY